MYPIKKILNTQLFRISSLNSVSVVVRIAGGLLSSKIIALFIGPAGMAVTGSLRNFITSLENFSTLGLQNGIIKYTAENEKDPEKLQRTLATVCISILTAIIFFSVILLIPAPYWSEVIFNGTDQYAWVFRVIALILPLHIGNLVFVALLNGLGNYKQVIYLNMWGNLIGVLLSAVLIWQTGLDGALLALALYPALLFIFSFYHVQRHFPYFSFLKLKYFDASLLKGLLSYSLMSLVTAILGPVIIIAIRNNIIQTTGANDAGYWDAITRISTFYLMFASTLLTVYFLPKLSIANTNTETKTVFYNYFKSIVPLYAAGLVVIYLLRFFIIKLLFSNEFLPMANLFLWQLAGDFFKICSLILGFEFFAKKMTKAFIVTEVISFCLLFASSKILIAKYGSEGAVMAHAFTYLLLLIGMALFFRKKII